MLDPVPSGGFRARTGHPLDLTVQDFSGHVFEGRYRTELIEDETYLWTVTRYVHLNPVRVGLVENPSAWAWSSYPGYAHRGRRLDWVAYDEVLESWAGAVGGRGPAADYRRYVTGGTVSTNADIAVILGLSRAECVPNLTRRMTAALAADAKVRRRLKHLETRLDESTE